MSNKKRQPNKKELQEIEKIENLILKLRAELNYNTAKLENIFVNLRQECNVPNNSIIAAELGKWITVGADKDGKQQVKLVDIEDKLPALKEIKM